jgi:hypothetical protein
MTECHIGIRFFSAYLVMAALKLDSRIHGVNINEQRFMI